MDVSRRIDVFVAKSRLRDRPQPIASEAPLWAVVGLGVLLLVGVIFVATANHPVVYGFVAAMVVAGVAERVIDGRSPSWGEGHVVAEVESDAVVFRTYRGALALAVVFLVAILGASVFFVAALLAPRLDLPMWFSAFGVLLVAGIVQGVRLIVRSLRRVDLRLGSAGVTAISLLGRTKTVRWSSLVAAFPAGRSIHLTTTDSSVVWPAHQLRADPVAVAAIIDGCATRSPVDVAGVVSVIDGLVSTSSAS